MLSTILSSAKNRRRFLKSFLALTLCLSFVLPQFFTPVHARASVFTTSIAPPPEAFLPNSSSGSLGLFAHAANIADSIHESITGPAIPKGLGMAKVPSVTERLGSAIASTVRTKAAPQPVPPPPPSGSVSFDFDGDGKADVARWHGANSEFKIQNSDGGTYSTFMLGTAGKPAPADYDGDGKTDAAVFNSGTWTIRQSSNGQNTEITGFGQSGDIPVSGNYVGTSAADAAVYRPSNGTWYVRETGNGNVASAPFGASGDIAVPGNYDGGVMDFAVFRPSTGEWHVLGSETGYGVFHWGVETDIPVPADFDGDGKTDFAVYRGSSGTWYAHKSSALGQYTTQTWGNYGDQPVAADFDGDGKADFAVWRPTNGVWYTINSSNSLFDYETLGSSGDMAVPSAYLKQIGGQVFGDSVAKARLSPKNATGGTNLYSQNFSWGTSLVGLSGRAGLDAGFGISYNSLVWTKDGNSIYFDTNQDNVSPGFRLGFPTIESIHYNDDPANPHFYYLMIAPSGGRVEFRQTAASDTYETADSSYLQLITKGAENPNDPVEDITITVRGTDGTSMSYEWKAGAFRCSQIKDRNGNFITIVHDDQGLLRTVTDTLGRVITVNYDSQLYPTSVTQEWGGGNGDLAAVVHTWATFSYTTKEINTNFSGIANVFGPPNGTSLKVLERITFADNGSTRFTHNSYGQVWKVQNYAADNHELNRVRTNLETPAANQPDCPRFGETITYVENFNGGNDVTVKNTSASGHQVVDIDGTTVTATRIQVELLNHPNGNVTNTYVYESGWKEGLPVRVDDYAAGNGLELKRSSWTKWTQDNPALPTLQNPRVIETKVSDGANTKGTEIDYHPLGSSVSQYGLVKEIRTYSSIPSNVLRKVVQEYNLAPAYLERRVIGLPSEIKVYSQDEGSNLVLASRTEFAYDDEGFDQEPNQNVTAVKHDANFGTTFVVGRGNLTKVTRHPVEGGLAPIVSKIRYDVAGSAVAAIDPIGRKSRAEYTDRFNDNIIRSSFAYPTKLIDPDGFFSEIKYRFDVGANVWAKSPDLNSTTPGKETAREFDDKGRILRETLLNHGGAFSRYEYFNSGVQSRVYSTIVDSNANGNADANDEVMSEAWADGAGRIRRTRSPHPTSSTGWLGQLSEYDVLGRMSRATVPTEITVPGGSAPWTPAGDDNRGTDSSGNPVWLWNTQEYDWKGRVTKRINTDGSFSEAIYEGCGCAGGEAATIKGEEIIETTTGGQQQSLGRRTRKIYTDPLGREYKRDVFEWDGTTVYSSRVSQLNEFDKPVWTKQYDGGGWPSNPRYQQTSFTYDGFGRLASQKLAQQLSPTQYTYFADDKIHTLTDSRGAASTYTYNSRGLLSNINWSVSSGSNILVPSAVAFSYDNAGNRTLMTDQMGHVSYTYDELSRLEQESRHFYGQNVGGDLQNAPGGAGIFNISYEYEFSGALKRVTDPWGQSANYAHNTTGQTTSISGSWFAGGNHSYLANVKYRAWGAVKSTDYLNNAGTTTESLTYNSKLLPATYSLTNPNVSTPLIQKTYQHYSDGAMKYIKDGDPNGSGTMFDRSYKFDHVGRMREGRTGSEARGGPIPDPAERPYAYDWTYDVWDNPTSTTLNQWSTGGVAQLRSYVNDRITNTGYAYDNDGRLTASEGISYSYDAAGNMHFIELSNVYNQGRWTNGEGNLVREHFSEFVIDQNFPNGHYVARGEVKYYIRSTLFNGKVLSEALRNGRKDKTYVHGFDKVVGKQIVNYNQYPPGSTTEMIAWTYSDVSGASIRDADQLQLNPEFAPRHELDTIGNDTGVSPPSQEPGGGGEPPWNYPPYGSNYDGGNCTVDGIETPCSVAFGMLANGSGDIDWSTSDPVFLAHLGIFEIPIYAYQDAPDLPDSVSPEGNIRINTTTGSWHLVGYEYNVSLLDAGRIDDNPREHGPSAPVDPPPAMLENPCELMVKMLRSMLGALIKHAGGEEKFLKGSHDDLDNAVRNLDLAFSGFYLGHPADTAWNIKDLSTTFGRGSLPDRTASGIFLGSEGFKPEFYESGHDQTHHFAAHFSLGINGQGSASLVHRVLDPSKPDVALTNAAYPLGYGLRNHNVSNRSKEDTAKDRAKRILKIADDVRETICE